MADGEVVRVSVTMLSGNAKLGGSLGSCVLGSFMKLSGCVNSAE